jgi:hypothetical protein
MEKSLEGVDAMVLSSCFPNMMRVERAARTTEETEKER